MLGGQVGHTWNPEGFSGCCGPRSFLEKAEEIQSYPKTWAGLGQCKGRRLCFVGLAGLLAAVLVASDGFACT